MKEDTRPALEKACDSDPKLLAKLEKAWEKASMFEYPYSVNEIFTFQITNNLSSLYSVRGELFMLRQVMRIKTGG